MDKYMIDEHKLMYHAERLGLWLNSREWENVRKIYPIYVEISLSSVCNHRCKFCALDYLGYKDGFVNFENLKDTILQMSKGGVRSIMFGGDGEPLLFPKSKEIILYTKKLGIDVAITTNGSALTKKFCEETLPFVSWVKVSIDAGTEKTHKLLHRPKNDGDFEKILLNLKDAVEIKKKKKLDCTIGGQMILLPENSGEVLKLAKILKEIGIDYFVVKRYSHNDLSITQGYKHLDYSKYLGLKKDLEKLGNNQFSVAFRENTMKREKESRCYEQCHAVPMFWAFLMTNGDVYGCGNFLGEKEFKMGNYNEKSFKEIWEGEGRKKVWNFVKKDLDIKKCRGNCRMDSVNEYLEKLKNPPRHVNFI